MRPILAALLASFAQDPRVCTRSERHVRAPLRTSSMQQPPSAQYPARQIARPIRARYVPTPRRQARPSRRDTAFEIVQRGCSSSLQPAWQARVNLLELEASASLLDLGGLTGSLLPGGTERLLGAEPGERKGAPCQSGGSGRCNGQAGLVKGALTERTSGCDGTARAVNGWSVRQRQHGRSRLRRSSCQGTRAGAGQQGRTLGSTPFIEG
jgi:hypothetical protein